MTSAFGVEHAVSKSFRRLGPKLRGALQDVPGQSMDERVRHNYAMFRNVAGNRGLNGKPRGEDLELQQRFKQQARASVTAAGNISRRKGRKLP